MAYRRSPAFRYVKLSRCHLDIGYGFICTIVRYFVVRYFVVRYFVVRYFVFGCCFAAVFDLRYIGNGFTVGLYFCFCGLYVRVFLHGFGIRFHRIALCHEIEYLRKLCFQLVIFHDCLPLNELCERIALHHVLHLHKKRLCVRFTAFTALHECFRTCHARRYSHASVSRCDHYEYILERNARLHHLTDIYPLFSELPHIVGSESLGYLSCIHTSTTFHYNILIFIYNHSADIL